MLKSSRLVVCTMSVVLMAATSAAEHGPNGEGQLLWQYHPPDSEVFDWCQPAIVYRQTSGQRIILYGEGSEESQGRLLAIDADTHQPVWGPISFPGPIGNSTVTLSDDGARAYFGEGSKPGSVYCVDTSDGHIVWTASSMPQDAGAFMACGALSHDGQTFYIGSGAWPEDRTLADKRFYAINTASGKLRWIFRSATHPDEGESHDPNYGSFFCDPAVLTNGDIIAATFSGHIYCLRDRGTHPEEIWDFELIDHNAADYPDSQPFHQEIWASPAIAADGTIYIASNAGKVLALDPATGGLKWETERVGGEIFGALVIGLDGEIYVGAEDHYLYAFQPPATPTRSPVKPTARWLWRDRWPNGGTVLANGEVVFGGELGNRYVSVKLVGGKLVKQWESDPVGAHDEKEAKTEPLIDPVTHTIYVSGGHSGGLYALKGTQPMAVTAWPKVQRDMRNSGAAAAP